MKNKIVPIHFRGAPPELADQQASMPLHPFAVMKLQEAYLAQAKLAVKNGRALVAAEADLASRRAVVANQYGRFMEAERQAAKLGVGEDAPPIGSWTMALSYAAVFAFEFCMAILGMQAVTA